MTDKEINNLKYKVCCPVCDNAKCVRGTNSCEAEIWARDKKKERNKMTKIIRKRNKLKCGLCKSTFRFESEDVKEKVYELNGGHSYYYVSCPVCKSEKVTSFWI